MRLRPHFQDIAMAILFISVPSAAGAQRYGYAGHWHGGYPHAHYAYGGYGYRPYYGYRAYRPYYGYAPWAFPWFIGAVFAPPPVYVYPVLPPPPPPPPPAPQYQQCPDGSTVPVGSHCVVHQAIPAPAPAPVIAPQPTPERG